MIRLWTTDDFEGHWPVGSAAVVWADTEEEARALLDDELRKCGLPNSVSAAGGYALIERDLSMSIAVVLCDGNY